MLKLYDSLDKKLEEFKPVKETATMYYCGPTVYSTQHIGNMRAFVVMDSLRRAILFNGIPVESTMNITDVGHMTSDEDAGDDKMILASQKEHKSPYEVAEYYTKICLEDMKKLNILTPTHIQKATECIPEIIDFVQTLLNNGFAYQTPNGIYYDITKYKDYGKLGGMEQDKKRMGARIEVDEFKRNPADFALWIKAPKEHIMQWDSPWGKGYPGWHIECSTICHKFFGDNVDIHGGGVEHKPVHHENEIAQNYGLTGKKVVQHWIHHEHLMVDGGKMSKSLGNVWNLSALIEKGYSPLALRYFYLNAHYAKQQNFTLDELKSCDIALKRLYKSVVDHKNGSHTTEKAVLDELYNKFKDAVNDNLNLPLALSVMWDMAKIKEKSPDVYNLMVKCDLALGLDLENAEKHIAENEQVFEDSIKELAEKRWTAKKNKDWATADSIRNQLKEMGYEIKDSIDGYTINKI